jgi:hypothetical protein
MKLELESGDVYDDVDEGDIVEAINGDGFAILGEDPMTYLQCAPHPETPGEFVVEYQEGSEKRHFHAVDTPVTLDRVVAAFGKYLRKDASWKRDFKWEKDELIESFE